jgi:YD repeat-containing protein
MPNSWGTTKTETGRIINNDAAFGRIAHNRAISRLDSNPTAPTIFSNFYMWQPMPLAKATSAVWTAVTNIAVLTNGTSPDIVATNVGTVFLPQSPETYAYDADGNLAQDGRWNYTWDGENRLVGMTSLSSAPTASKISLSFVYDYMGRRIGKWVPTNIGARWVTPATRWLWRMAMRNLIVCSLMFVSCSGCAGGTRLREVTFEWFNLSTNEIWITEAVGLPDQSWAGRLMPVHSEGQLSVAGSVIMETVHIKDRIVIKWKDDGKQGWPGGLKQVPLQPPTIPPGTAHEAVFKRANLGVPSKLTHAKLRFTYLGQAKWRIKIYGPTTIVGDTDQVEDFSPPYKP